MERQIDIIDLFTNAGDLYQQKPLSTFYVSQYSRNGLHLGIYPDEPTKIYSEYTFGNTRDMKRVAEASERTVFKSFYCDVCAIEEPDHVAVKDACGTLKPGENFALGLNHKLTYGNIPFLVCGLSRRRWYVNELLFSPQDHYSTYAIFENFELFSGTFGFSADLAKQEPSAKLIFDGTSGLDAVNPWHFCAHVTPANIQYVDVDSTSIGNMSQEEFSSGGIYEQNRNLGIVNYKLVASDNLTALFERIFALTRLVYLPEYISKFRYLAAIFQTVLTSENTPRYIVFLTTGIFRPPVIGGETFWVLYPSATVSVGGHDIRGVTPKLLDAISAQITQNGSYTDWRTIPLIEQPKASLRVEAFERMYRKNCAVDYLALPDVKNIFRTVDKCVSTTEGCEAFGFVYDTYKYIMSLVFTCTVVRAKREGADPRQLELDAYKKLIGDPIFLSHALKSGMAYLSNTYGVKNTNVMFLKGPVTAKIFETSFNNFNLLTSTETSISKTRFAGQSQAINEWVNFEGYPIPLDSTNAKITIPSSLRLNPEIRFTLKTVNPLRRDAKTRNLFLAEFATGIKINDLRRKIPNFIITLGGFECPSDPALQSLCRGGTDMQYLILENVAAGPTLSFDSYVAMPTTTPLMIYAALYQLSAALLYAQKQLDFTHYNLHPSNVLVTYLAEPSAGPSLYKYKFGDVTFDIPAFVNCSIVDYGTTHVSGLSELSTAYREDAEWGFAHGRPQFNRDIFTLIMGTFHVFLASKSPVEISEFYLTDNPFKKLVEGLFAGYSTPEVFVPNAFDKIKRQYEQIFPTLDPAARFTKAREIISSTRIGPVFTKLFFYLPTNTPFPSQGIFKSSMILLNSFAKTKLPPVSDIDFEYRWGEYNIVGCFPIRPAETTKEVEIAALKELILKMKASPAKSAPKKAKAAPAPEPPPAPKPEPKPKPSTAKPPPEPKGKAEPPKPKKKPRAEPPPKPKRKPRAEPTPKPSEKAASERVTAKDRRLLADIEQYKFNLFQQIGGRDNVTRDVCQGIQRQLAIFWTNITNSDVPKHIRTEKDMLKFKRQTGLLFHPDRFDSAEKKKWATQMQIELNDLRKICAELL